MASKDPNSCSADAAADRRAKAAEVVGSIENLNASQRSAVAESMIRRCTIVQGPPGTGKTHVSVRVLQSWVKVFGLSPILATSDSNIAVDNIAEGLRRAGIRAVRVGRPDKCREHLEEMTLDSMLTAKKQEDLKAAREAAVERSRKDGDGRDVQSGADDAGLTGRVADSAAVASGADGGIAERATGKRNSTGEIGNPVNKRKQRAEDMKLRTEILNDAEVICITTMSAGGTIIRDFQFRAALIDEVAQATEISTIVPVVLRGAKQLVLVGDHCQLPPTCISREAELRGLSLSLYQRLAAANIEPNFLDTQYRSHPKLAEFSGKCFYRGVLKSDVAEASRPIPKGVPWPNAAVPVAFLEVGAKEVLEGESKANHGEAHCLVSLVKEVLHAGELRMEDIGIITPYMAQVHLLRRLLKEQLPCDPKQFLEVASIDSFQGREKELIIFSAVRSNYRGNVGFLGDWRRLNVMLTRARRGLVVLGSAQTLRCDPTWKQWLEWCHGHDGVGSAAAAESWGGKCWNQRGWKRCKEEVWEEESRSKRRHEASWREESSCDDAPLDGWERDGEEEQEFLEDGEPEVSISPFASSGGAEVASSKVPSPFGPSVGTSLSNPFAASPFGRPAQAGSPFAASTAEPPASASCLVAPHRVSSVGISACAAEATHAASPFAAACGHGPEMSTMRHGQKPQDRLVSRARCLATRKTRPHARVLTPLAWREVESDLSDTGEQPCGEACSDESASEAVVEKKVPAESPFVRMSNGTEQQDRSMSDFVGLFTQMQFSEGVRK